MRRTQRERLLEILRADRQVCSWTLAYRSYMPHASSRIPELNARGFVIRGETKDWSDGHGAHAHYFLEYDPERQPQQLRLSA